MSDIPSSARSTIDLYTDEVLTNPYPAYRALRDQGAAVYLQGADVWFLGRFADVKRALGDWQSFSSAHGIGLNPIINRAWEEALICQDPPVHTDRRKIINEVLGPMALKPVQQTIDRRANELVERLVSEGEVDGVRDFAHDLPVSVVMDLIGWPEDVRPELLGLAEGSWNAAGPDNPRMRAGLVQLERMMKLIADIYDHNRVEPGGFAAQLLAASHAGRIERETAIGMLAGYVVAAFETTISATAAGLALFAAHPHEWEKFRLRPELATRAANEIVRIESPLQNFSRWVATDVVLSDGSPLAAGRRVIVSYASANRDERVFETPDEFRIDRKESQQLGFGYGPHNCAGQSLARMEMTSVFTALAKRVRTIEIAGRPERALNNVSRAYRRLPVRLLAA